MKSTSLSYARRKALRETSWSIIVIVIMSVGFTGGIIIPSVGSSLQSGVEQYANAVATYVVVQNNGNPSTLNQTIPPALLNQIASIDGVQQVYPVVTNYTIFLFHPPRTLGNVRIGNTTMIAVQASLGFLSAVVGGSTGYPPQLVDPAIGRAPGAGESGFLFNSNQDNPFNVSNSAQVQVAGTNFTATELGINKYIPLIGNNLGVLWDSSFMKNKLGGVLFDQTFGKGVNFIIVKAVSINDVPSVVSRLQQLFAGYSSYFVTYDQGTVHSLTSLETGVAPLYELLGVVSLAFAAIAVLTVSYISVSRRGWEAGLLLSQGWTWKNVRNYFIFYFLILAGISLALSVMASYALSRYTGSAYEVYGGYLDVAVSPGLGFVLAASVMALLLSVVSSFLIIRRLQRTGLDKILRDF